MNFVTYQDFTKTNGHLPVNEAEKVYQTILASVETTTPEFEALWQDMITAAIKYGTTRALWLTLSPEEQQKNEAKRTDMHNDLIFSITMLHGYFAQQAWDVSWINLFTVNDDIDRKRIGDFGCYLAYIYSLNAR